MGNGYGVVNDVYQLHSGLLTEHYSLEMTPLPISKAVSIDKNPNSAVSQFRQHIKCKLSCNSSLFDDFATAQSC
jgi:hypothetical protein